MPEDRRLKYDSGMRLAAAGMFAEGRGYRAVATKLGLSPTTARKRHRAYASLGIEGLLVTGKKSRGCR